MLSVTDHRPYALPASAWRMTQRWNDLLFAHWPITVETMARLLPPGLEVDPFDGWAWAGVVPFWMDRIRVRGMGPGALGRASFGVPGVRGFPELNLRTYVRSRATGLPGVYFFSLDAGTPLAVLGARVLFHLPYYLARMRRGVEADGMQRYDSQRILTRRSVRFKARYRGLGAGLSGGVEVGAMERFLTERYCLFTRRGGRVVVGDIHHLPWPLEPAEAEFEVNELPEAHGIVLPKRAPVLHFARELEVYVWGLREETKEADRDEVRAVSSGFV